MSIRNLPRGLSVGLLAALASVGIVILAALLYVNAPIGEATVAVGTLALAMATA